MVEARLYCTRCQKHRPPSEFRAGAKKGTFSRWCTACLRESKQKWLSRNEDYVVRELEFKRIAAGDPLVYSRATCRHVAAFVDRAIERFEKKSGKEAPPHMTALRDIALTFVREHPEEELGRDLICENCGQEWTMRLRERPYRICRNCRSERRRQISNHEARMKSRLESYVEGSASSLRYLPRATKIKLVRDAKKSLARSRAELAYVFRIYGASWAEISEKFGFSGTGHAYNVVYGRDGRRYAPGRDKAIF